MHSKNLDGQISKQTNKQTETTVYKVATQLTNKVEGIYIILLLSVRNVIRERML